MTRSSGRWARAESARFPAWAGPFRGVARPPKAPPGRYGRVNGPVRDPARVGGANTYLVYAEVGSDRRTTSRRRRRRAREGRCDLSRPVHRQRTEQTHGSWSRGGKTRTGCRLSGPLAGMPLLVRCTRSEYTILDISRMSWRGRIYVESVGERARRTEGFLGQVEGTNL